MGLCSHGHVVYCFDRFGENQPEIIIFLPSLSANFCASAPLPDAKLPSTEMILLFSLKRDVDLSPKA